MAGDYHFAVGRRAGNGTWQAEDGAPPDVANGSFSTELAVRVMSTLTPIATESGHLGSAGSCQQETHAAQQFNSLFDHLVGSGEQRWWDVDALCLPQIKPEHIGDAVHPKSDGKECAPLPRRHVISARPYPRTGACASHYSNSYTTA